jgi:hypothetical protein
MAAATNTNYWVIWLFGYLGIGLLDLRILGFTILGFIGGILIFDLILI